MEDSPGKRLASFRKSLGLNQRDFANTLSVSPGRIGSIETDAAEPSRAFLQKISDRYNLSADWLLHGTGDMTLPQVPGFAGRRGRIEPPQHDRPAHGDFQFDGEEFAMIRRMDLSISAGSGLIPVEGGGAEAMAFSRTWLLRAGINSDLAVLVRVKGDSMAPSIPDGALVLVHLPEAHVERAGIYAFNRDGSSFIKRLVPSGHDAGRRASSIAIVSDNPAYPTEVLVGTDLNQLRVIGKVRSVLYSV